MFFEWDGVRFKNKDGKWYCLDYAMRGPTGSMHNKEVPEPWQSMIEESWKEQNDRTKKTEVMSPDDSKSGLIPSRSNQKNHSSKKNHKKNNRKMIESKLEQLIEKENRSPKVPRKKRSNIVGGLSLKGLMGG